MCNLERGSQESDPSEHINTENELDAASELL